MEDVEKKRKKRKAKDETKKKKSSPPVSVSEVERKDLKARKKKLKSIEQLLKDDKDSQKEKKPRKMSKQPSAIKKVMDEGGSVTAAFKDSLEIGRLLDSNENDNAASKLRKDMLKMVVSLMPMAEESYRKFPNDRNVYALNALISSARELIAELQADTDRGTVIHKFTHQFVQPQIRILGNAIVNESSSLLKALQNHIHKDSRKMVQTTVNHHFKNIGSAVQESMVAIQDGMGVVLNET